MPTTTVKRWRMPWRSRGSGAAVMAAGSLQPQRRRVLAGAWTVAAANGWAERGTDRTGLRMWAGSLLLLSPTAGNGFRRSVRTSVECLRLRFPGRAAASDRRMNVAARQRRPGAGHVPGGTDRRWGSGLAPCYGRARQPIRPCRTIAAAPCINCSGIHLNCRTARRFAISDDARRSGRRTWGLFRR